MKFLVVDDDLITARLISLELENLGIESDIAESAEIAHKLFVVNHYDGLIVDLVLPGISGTTMVKELREFRPDVPVLFCSGATDAFNKQLMWSLGLVFHKPIDASFSAVLQQFARFCKKT